MSNTRNGGIPYERQVKPILRRYDQMAEENARMRATLSEIHETCDISNVAEKFHDLQKEIEELKKENADLKRLADNRKKKLDEIELVVKDGLKSMGVAVPCYFPLIAKVRFSFQAFGYLKDREGI